MCIKQNKKTACQTLPAFPRRRAMPFVLICLLLAALAACSAVKDESWEIGMNSSADTAPRESGEAQEQEGAAFESAGKAADTAAAQKVILKTAQLDIYVSDVRGSYANILDWAKQNDGYEFRQDTGTNGDYVTIQAQIKIPPEHLDSFILFINQCGEVVNCTVNSQDVTEDYFDTQLRLKTKRAGLDKYYEILAGAQSVNEILQVQAAIDGITEEIENLEGRLNAWDQLAKDSTVTLTLNEKEDPNRVERTIQWNALSVKDMGWLIAQGFTKALNMLVSFFQWLLILFISALPVLLPLAALLVLLLYLKRRRKKHREPKA